MLRAGADRKWRARIDLPDRRTPAAAHIGNNDDVSVLELTQLVGVCCRAADPSSTRFWP